MQNSIPCSRPASLLLCSIHPLQLRHRPHQISLACIDIHTQKCLLRRAAFHCSYWNQRLRLKQSWRLRGFYFRSSPNWGVSWWVFKLWFVTNAEGYLVSEKPCWKYSIGTLRSACISPSPRKWPVPGTQQRTNPLKECRGATRCDKTSYISY